MNKEKEKQSASDLIKTVREFINDPTVYPEDLDWLFNEMSYTDIYLDAVKLRWQEMGEDFFLWFIELSWKKSFLHGLINVQMFPGRNESVENEVEEFLVGAYDSSPYKNQQAKDFRVILKDTLVKIWGFAKSDIYHVNQIHFLNGPMASCQSLSSGCDQQLYGLTFTHELLDRGGVQQSICHEVGHVMLKPVSLEKKVVEEMVLGITRYLMVFVEGGKS